MATAPPPAPMPAYMPPPMRPNRPLGVAILAILTVIFGIIGLLGGLVILGFSGLGFAMGLGPLAAFGAAVGAIILIFGLIAIVAGLGLWSLRPWAWWLAVIVAVVQLLFNGLTLNFTLVLWLIILVYLLAVRGNFTARPAGM